MKNNKGFTLVELIIVIAILAIIMLIAIPNFSGIQQRMQVRADKATAAQIGKAVRVWFTDCTTDKSLVAEATKADYVPGAIESGTWAPAHIPTKAKLNPGPTDPVYPIRYENLMGIEGYISLEQEPNSLKGTDEDTDKNQAIPNQIYSVFLTEDSTSSAAKIVVAITSSSNEDYKMPTLTNPLSVNYDGAGAGIAYIEP